MTYDTVDDRAIIDCADNLVRVFDSIRYDFDERLFRRRYVDAERALCLEAGGTEGMWADAL